MEKLREELQILLQVRGLAEKVLGDQTASGVRQVKGDVERGHSHLQDGSVHFGHRAYSSVDRTI